MDPYHLKWYLQNWLKTLKLQTMMSQL
ncbi:hypothetical protein Gogos_020581 [Gossypium gossypioides]|uniref:Uncharacterized protein n=1 Tax=Gossypium gossypioides TaxID=34282 RepID=A0A7J9D5L0_GOSGO|nr:hypothetical protein [Gossypium gossypioides]